ncbi:carotenoid 1,2-hydratase [Roseibium denhamense]|nr:carotenoid 1,2-hydratase [Roseibium denhamense]
MSDCGRHALTVIAFIGSVFSPYYHWSGRRQPENHIAFNVALYQAAGHIWAMTERGTASLHRDQASLRIGPSGLTWSGGELVLDFKETALPWPGQRIVPKAFSGQIRLTPEVTHDREIVLDPEGRHLWWPVVPQARAALECDLLPDGGWQGEGYHDQNFGTQPLEKDFSRWDWARGRAPDDTTLIVYDALSRSGAQTTLGFAFSPYAGIESFDPPPNTALPRGLWGVSGGVHCEEGYQPKRLKKLEDTPFYTRSLVETKLQGQTLNMMHESLDCRRLANPLVRLMLPFRMPRQIFR